MLTSYQVRPISDRTAFTGKHRRSPFDSTWGATRSLLLREVSHLGGRGLVLEVDVREDQIRLDGELYANARPASPAVRAAFDSSKGPLIYATDAFATWQDNVRAIALGLEALRRFDRYEIRGTGDQYTGFKQLGGGSGAEASAMTSDDAWAIIGSFGDRPIHEQRAAGQPDSRTVRRARAFAHPDKHGGDRELSDQVNEALRVLGVK